MTQTIEQLTARVRELEEENERLKAECDDIKQVQFPRKLEAVSVGWKKQLAAEQLNNKLLRDALDDTFSFLERHSNRWDGINGKHPQVVAEAAREALSIPASTEALDKYVAEKVKEKTDALHYRMEHCYSIDHVKIQCELDKITKQRDLAVEAIRHCIAAMGSVTDVKKAMDWPQLHNAQMLSLQALDAIRESEVKR